MKNLISRKVLFGAVCASFLTTACSDVVVKVKKEPRKHDFSALNDFDGLNLASSDDFLKDLDDLKIMAVDLIIKKFNEKDYRKLFRDGVRKYRASLIEKAQGPAKLDDSFYSATEDQCVERKLDFNMHESNKFLGMILQTAVLAKISEVSASKLNAGLTKEIAAIAQLIKIELGVEIDGETTVEKDGENTITKGNFTVKLAAIDGEEISDEMKEKDATEVLSLSFDRVLGPDYVGTFDATLGISYSEDEQTKTAQGTMSIERKAVDGKFVHSIGFAVGQDGAPASYARKLTFEQVNDDEKKLKITDTINPGLDSEKSYVTIIDIEAGTLCKMTGNDTIDGDETGAKDDNLGDESGFQPGGDEGDEGTDKETDSDTDTDTDSDADDNADDSTDEPADDDQGDDASDDQAGDDTGDDTADDSSDDEPTQDKDTPPTDDSDDDADKDVNPDNDDDDSDDDDDIANPGDKDQTPGQHPGHTAI